MDVLKFLPFLKGSFNNGDRMLKSEQDFLPLLLVDVIEDEESIGIKKKFVNSFWRNNLIVVFY